MLNNLNVTALLKSEIAPAVDRQVKRADTNRDGHLSTSEFSQFLADVVRKLELADAATASGGAAAERTDGTER